MTRPLIPSRAALLADEGAHRVVPTSFPLRASSGNAPASPSSQPDPDYVPRPSVLAGKTVVVVEDEGVTQLQLRHILRKAGLVVVGAAATGEEGIQVVRTMRPDVVLMDISMPGEVDGLSAAEEILRTDRTCLLMLTAYD